MKKPLTYIIYIGPWKKPCVSDNIFIMRRREGGEMMTRAGVGVGGGVRGISPRSDSGMLVKVIKTGVRFNGGFRQAKFERSRVKVSKKTPMSCKKSLTETSGHRGLSRQRRSSTFLLSVHVKVTTIMMCLMTQQSYKVWSLSDYNSLLTSLSEYVRCHADAALKSVQGLQELKKIGVI